MRHIKIRFLLVACVFPLFHQYVYAAGLDLASVPLFVTDVLQPNVILSSPQRYPWKETAMKNPPSDILLACVNRDFEKCPKTDDPNADPNYATPDPYFVLPFISHHDTIITKYRSWAQSELFYGSIERPGVRVTPWPGMYKCAGNRQNTDFDMACSDYGVYARDWTFVKKFGVTAEARHGPLAFTKPLVDKNLEPAENLPVTPSGDDMSISEEPYYQSDSSTYKSSSIYDGARAKYYRSTDNFLYFNPALKYEPWPTLGVAGATYTPFTYTKENAHLAKYNPLTSPFDRNGIKYDNVLADLSSPGKTWLWDGYYAEKPADHGADEMDYLIGRYYIRKQNAPVWQSSSYVEYTWNHVNKDYAFDDDDKINFANWFTYWRSSYLATRGILSTFLQTLHDRDLLHRFRIGISHENTTTKAKSLSLDSASFNISDLKNYNDRVDLSSSFLKRLGSTIFADSTDFHWDYTKAFDYFKTLPPYRDNPNLVTSTPRSCRRNYEVIVSPDYTYLRADNYATTSVTNANGDQDMGAPYSDLYSDTFGDWGAQGWRTDLRNDLANNLLKGKNNSATHQHLVRYLIGPKIEGRMFPSTTSSYEQALSIAKSNDFPGWKDMHELVYDPDFMVNLPARDIYDSIDDLWHMAINSHGMFYPSDSVTDAISNLLVAFNDILVRNVSGAAVATNTTSLQDGGVIYQATVENDWRGHLRAYTVKKTGEGAAARLVVDYSREIWDLATSLSASDPDNRVIFTYNRNTKDGSTFKWDNIGAINQNLLSSPFDGSTVKAQSLLNYLRGTGSCEDGAKTTCLSDGAQYMFRRRNIDSSNTDAFSASNPNGRNLLGDISNSNPWVVSAPIIGVSDVDYPGYNKHRISLSNRPKMLYVGANDGMLHAVRVDAALGENDVIVTPAGTELFAYIPSFVQTNLHYLSSLDYSHQYYVDGSPFSAEVQVGSGESTKWATVLAGGGNLGGKGYYLLDITNPTSFTNTDADAGKLLMWEFTSTDDSDLQYTYNMPVAHLDGHQRSGQARQFARMQDGNWALILGNGYQAIDALNPDQPGQKACLFILNVNGPSVGTTWEKGADYHKICVGKSNYSVEDKGLNTNGLSTPTPIDTNGDGYTDYIYAGDLNGNVWRFDVNSSSTDNWTVANSGNPIFVAKDSSGVRQPIIAPIETVNFSYNTVTGPFLLFGTGKYIETNDRVDSSVQSFYGIWDRGSSDLDRSMLLKQEYASKTLDNGLLVRHQEVKDIKQPKYCTESIITDCDKKDHFGWYWDMPSLGERLTGRISAFAGRVYFNTFYPELDTSAKDADGNQLSVLDPCQYGGDGWIMAINATGGYMESDIKVLDTNQDGLVNSDDTYAAGANIGAAIGGTTFAKGLNEGMIGVYSPADLGADEGKRMAIATAGSNRTRGRVSWQELLD